MTRENRLFDSAKSVWAAVIAASLLGVAGVIGLVADLAQLESWLTSGIGPIVRVASFLILLTAVVIILSKKSRRDRYTLISGIIAILSVATFVLSYTLWPKVATEAERSAGALSAVPTSEQQVAEPLVVAVDPQTHSCDSDWVTPKRPDEISRLNEDLQALESWEDYEPISDGAPADSSKILMTAQGVGPSSVVITGLEIVVLDRKAPLNGTVIARPCGGPLAYRWVDVDLDVDHPRVVGRELSGDTIEEARENGWRIEPVAFPYEVAAQTSETFAVEASTDTCDCTWEAKFHWSSNGRTGVLTVDNHGTPFRTTSGEGMVRCVLLGATPSCR